MKIGIMTWWRNTNYGGFLQGLALQTFLKKNGFDVEMIRFAFPPIQFTARSVICPHRLTSLRQGLGAVLDVVRALFVNGCLSARLSRLRKTVRLFDAYITPSPHEYASLAELAADGRYDTVLIGSDQVWTPKYHDADFSYLLRGLGDSVRKVSYAASVAAPSVHPYEKIYGEALARFEAISVREKTNVAELEKLSGKKVEWVVDPTLLLSAEDWRVVLNLRPDTPEPHITVYWLSPLEDKLPELVRLAKEKRMKVHIFTDVMAFRVVANPLRWAKHLAARVRLACSPSLELHIGADAREWLQDLSTADFILSDSFHALMFATLFNREIKVEIPKAKKFMATRITDFQSRKGALADWIAHSRAWLMKNGQGCPQ